MGLVAGVTRLPATWYKRLTSGEVEPNWALDQWIREEWKEDSGAANGRLELSCNAFGEPGRFSAQRVRDLDFDKSWDTALFLLSAERRQLDSDMDSWGTDFESPLAWAVIGASALEDTEEQTWPHPRICCPEEVEAIAHQIGSQQEEWPEKVLREPLTAGMLQDRNVYSGLKRGEEAQNAGSRTNSLIENLRAFYHEAARQGDITLHTCE